MIFVCKILIINKLCFIYFFSTAKNEMDLPNFCHTFWSCWHNFHETFGRIYETHSFNFFGRLLFDFFIFINAFAEIFWSWQNLCDVVGAWHNNDCHYRSFVFQRRSYLAQNCLYFTHNFGRSWAKSWKFETLKKWVWPKVWPENVCLITTQFSGQTYRQTRNL